MKSTLFLFLSSLLVLSPLQAGVQLNVSSQASQDSMTASSTVSSGDNAKFSCESLLLLSSRDQSLLPRIVDHLRPLIAQLAQVHRIEQRTVASTSSVPFLPDGARAPDLFLWLEMPRWHERGWLTRGLEITVQAHLGTAPWEGHYSVIDETTPPLISYRWNGTLQHSSQTKGLEFPKNQAAVLDIANQLAHAITNEILKQVDEHGALPPLPEKLYGPFHPAPDLPFPRDFKTERLCSYYGLLTHNETFWRTAELTNPEPILKTLDQQLQAARWRIETLSLSNAPQYYLRATLGRSSLEVFNPSALFEPGAAKPASVRLMVHYREPLTRPERAAALEEMLSADAPLPTLLLFRNSFSETQWNHVIQRLEQNPTSDPNACLLLARDRLGRHQTNQAIALLIRAKALAQALGDPGGAQSKVQSLAREIHPKGELPLAVVPATYRDLGFLEVTNTPQPLTVEKPLGQPALFFAVDPKGQVRTLALRLDPPSANHAPAPVHCFQSGPGMQSSSSSSVSLSQLSSWRQTFNLDRYPVEVRLSNKGEGLAIRYELSPRPFAK